MDPVIALKGLSKTYDSGLVALQPIDLTINRGEIFALLGTCQCWPGAAGTGHRDFRDPVGIDTLQPWLVE